MCVMLRIEVLDAAIESVVQCMSGWMCGGCAGSGMPFVVLEDWSVVLVLVV